MLAVYTTLNASWVLVWQFFARRHTGLRFRKAAADILPYLITAVMDMGMTLAATAWIENLLLSLMAKICIAALMYAGAIRIFRPSDFREALEMLHRRKKAS